MKIPDENHSETHGISDTEGTLRPMLRLAIPVLIEQFLSLMVVYSDTMLAGQYLEQSHISAITLMAYIMWLIPSSFAFVAIGATAMVARFVGAGDGRTAAQVANQALALGAILTVLLTLGLLAFEEPLLSGMRVEAEVAPLVSQYLMYLVLVLPAVMLTQVGPACLRGAGDTISGMIAMTSVNVVNVALSWGLVLGWGGLPELGWEGLAIGTAAGHLVGGLIMLGFFLRGRAGLKLRMADLRPRIDLIRRLLRIGLPGGSDIVSIILLHLWFLSIVFSLGIVASAAHGIAVRIESLAYLPGTAFQVAAATLAGQYLGAGQHRQATHAVAMACLVGGCMMTAAGVVLYAAAQGLVQLFVRPEEQEVIRQAVPLLRIVSISMPALALSMILTGALRGAGDTRWPFLFTLIGFLGVRIPGAYLLTTVLPWGVEGAWYAMVCDIIVRCGLVCWRFLQGGWKNIQV